MEDIFPSISPTAEQIQRILGEKSDLKKAEFLQRFFKTGKGEYAEGDLFLGISVPETRKIARQHSAAPYPELEKLLSSPYHESRLVALLILCQQFGWGTPSEREKIFNFYWKISHRINNWDLVDLSCPKIVGEFLLDKDRSLLYQKADSPLLWDQRISIVSTITFIRRFEYTDTLNIAYKLIPHSHDLIRKATGWMLREIGKRDRPTLEKFIEAHVRDMSSITLRYAIEHFTSEERNRYLSLRKQKPYFKQN